MATIYIVKKDIFTNKPVLKTGDSSNKTLNLKAWSKDEKTAFERFYENEKLARIKQEQQQEQAQKVFNGFNTELKALLKKYNASISWTCGEHSDLHGVYDESMVAGINGFDFELAEGDTI